MYRIILGEDHVLVRQGIRALLEKAGVKQYIAKAAGHVVNIAELTNGDLWFVDYMNGERVTKKIEATERDAIARAVGGIVGECVGGAQCQALVAVHRLARKQKPVQAGPARFAAPGRPTRSSPAPSPPALNSKTSGWLPQSLLTNSTPWLAVKKFGSVLI